MPFKHTSSGLAGNGTPFQLQASTVTLSSATGDVTLLLADYESPVVVVTGTMSGATTLILPNVIGGVVNLIHEATGAELKVKTVGGTAIPLNVGLNVIIVGKTLTVYSATKVASSISLGDANTTLTVAQSLSSFITFTGTLTAGRDVTFPVLAVGIVWIKNSTGQTLTLKQGASTATISNGAVKCYHISATAIEVLV